MARSAVATSYQPITESTGEEPSQLGPRHEIQQFTIDTPSPHIGIPASKSTFDLKDTLSVVTALLCLIAGVIIIDPRLPYAADLGFTNQIIAIGFILGVMNQCLQRILPFLFLLVEARYGQSTLQNFEGILRWSPFTDRLGYIWRTCLILLLVLPLALSILYKQYLGGVATKTLPSMERAFYTPTGPPGMRDMSAVLIMANATQPFLTVAKNDRNYPENGFAQPQPFGFNTIILSNTSAVAIDGPVTARLLELQQELEDQESIQLTATVRGTVVTYDPTLDNQRNDSDYWAPYEDLSLLEAANYAPGNVKDGPYGFNLGIRYKGLSAGDGPEQWNNSWLFVGTWGPHGGNTSDEESWKQAAMRFDLARHNCTVSWFITKGSVDLQDGTVTLDHFH
ncbi:hypothetical protein LTR84_012283 [Exophiala bonariae]|uniref:Uncharacterized protein n=1 Tax=Exophiala bonariae TaxID=1690606 RepID=A0AAV9NK74_9EURO|nr:hypothetical protein LTR84_012283 [Exophiala bonariae]